MRRFWIVPLLMVMMGASAHALPNIGLQMPGTRGKFTGPSVTLPGRVVSGKAAGAALIGAQPDTQNARGGAETALYARIAPAVVLIVTDEGLGSGSLISKDGQILTSYHVIKGFKTVGVMLKPEKEGGKLSPENLLTADVLRYDAIADLALVKLRTAPKINFTPIALGNFDSVKVGDDVNAIGHPEGEAWTFTKGYVSQVRRGYNWKPEGEDFVADVIQTQTPINPGNSGGPLLNAAGALIGVNAFVSAEGQGLNFAVGVDAVQAFLKNSGNREPLAHTKEAECKSPLMFEGRNKENDAAIRDYDTLCNGKVTLEMVLPDDKTQPLIALFDINADGTPDGMVLSNKRDGYWNISYWSSKGDGKWDTIGYHPDGKMEPTSYGPYIPDKK